MHRGRWIGWITLTLVAAACTPEPAQRSAATTPPTTDSSIASALRRAAEHVPEALGADTVAAGLEALRLDEASAPSRQSGTDLSDAMSRLEWSAILDAGDVQGSAAALERATLDAFANAHGAPVGASGSLPSGPGAMRAAAVQVAVRLAFDTGRSEERITEGTKDGTVTTSADVSFDAESGRETATWTIDADVTDSQTGERVAAHTEGESSRDVCWGEDGSRESKTTTATSVTTSTGDSSETSERSRTTSVRVDPDGSITVGLSLTVDGYTVGYTKGDSELSASPGEHMSEEGGRITYTFTVEGGGEATIAVDDGVEWSDDKMQRAADELGDAKRIEEDLAAAKDALKRPLVSSSPGGDEFCLKLSVDPAAAALEAGGDTLGMEATVLDWNGRPVTSAIVSIDGVRLGSVAPRLGPTATDGTWETTYTSKDRGIETLEFDAALFGYQVRRTARLTIASGYAFEWSDSYAGQTAHVTGTSCDGTAWTGELTFEGNPGGAELSMAGTFAFELDGAATQTEFVSRGTIGAASEQLPIEMPYTLDFTLDAEDGTAAVRMLRGSGGTITARGRRLPIPTEGFPEFVFTADLTPAAGCS